MLITNKILLLQQIFPKISQATPSINPNNSSVSSSNTPSIDLQLLINQLEFIQKSHEQLSTNFDTFVKSSHYSFQFFLGSIGALLTLVTIVGGILAWIFRKTLNDDFKKEAKKIQERAEFELKEIKSESLKNVSQEITRYEAYFQTIIDRESVIDEVKVYYLISNSDISKKKSFEYKILKSRGFQPLFFNHNYDNKLVTMQNSVVVLDLENSSNNATESEILKVIESDLPSNSALVIYYRGYSEAINQFKKDNKVEYYHIANGAISLVGAVVDAAYVIKTLRLTT